MAKPYLITKSTSGNFLTINENLEDSSGFKSYPISEISLDYTPHVPFDPNQLELVDEVAVPLLKYEDLGFDREKMLTNNGIFLIKHLGKEVFRASLNLDIVDKVKPYALNAGVDSIEGLANHVLTLVAPQPDPPPTPE